MHSELCKEPLGARLPPEVKPKYLSEYRFNASRLAIPAPRHDTSSITNPNPQRHEPLRQVDKQGENNSSRKDRLQRRLVLQPCHLRNQDQLRAIGMHLYLKMLPYQTFGCAQIPCTKIGISAQTCHENSLGPHPTTQIPMARSHSTPQKLDSPNGAA